MLAFACSIYRWPKFAISIRGLALRRIEGLLERTNQLRLSEASHRGNCFKADALRFEDLIELGNELVGLHTVALYDGLGLGLLKGDSYGT